MTADIISAYSFLSGAIVTCESGCFTISTPEGTYLFESKEDLMEDIMVNLACMEECVEPELWDEAWR